MHSSGIEPRATRPFIAAAQAIHEIQPQQAVGESRTIEAVVKENERATVKSCCSQEQELEWQQQAECQLQLQRQQPLRNDFRFNPRRKTFKSLFPILCDSQNLMLAFKKARKRKTKKTYVKDFEANLGAELGKLQMELLTGTYAPKPLKSLMPN